MPTVAARAQLTHASYRKCSRDLAPGEVKRCLQRGMLIAYYLGCPKCGFVGAYLHEKHLFVEEPPSMVPVYPKTILSIEQPPPCFSCKRLLVVVDGFMEAHDP